MLESRKRSIVVFGNFSSVAALVAAALLLALASAVHAQTALPSATRDSAAKVSKTGGTTRQMTSMNFPRGRIAVVGAATYGIGSSPGQEAIDLAVLAGLKALATSARRREHWSLVAASPSSMSTSTSR